MWITIWKMACESGIQKRHYSDEILPSAKRMCLDTLFADEMSNAKLNCSSNMFVSNSTDDPSSLTKTQVKQEPLTISDENATAVSNIIYPICTQINQEDSSNYEDNTSTFSDISYDSICAQIKQETLPIYNIDTFSNINPVCDKDILEEFFINLNLPCVEQSTSKTHKNDEIQPIPASNSASIIKKKSCYNVVYQQDLGNSLFLSLKLRNNAYNVHICEIMHSDNESISKKGLYINTKSWYEFQYKIFAFNLRFQSSSFVSNNTILALNMNNAIMHMKHLKNYSHIDLSEKQLECLKKVIHTVNKELLSHMYGKHLPYLIKRNCIVKEMTQEETLVILKTLYNCIEENLVTILNRIYECYACISGENCAKSLHPCTVLNNREKCQQLGINILMLVNLDFVLNTFTNRIEYISELFLNNLNVENIFNTIFKTIK